MIGIDCELRVLGPKKVLETFISEVPQMLEATTCHLAAAWVGEYLAFSFYLAGDPFGLMCELSDRYPQLYCELSVCHSWGGATGIALRDGKIVNEYTSEYENDWEPIDTDGAFVTVLEYDAEAGKGYFGNEASRHTWAATMPEFIQDILREQQGYRDKMKAKISELVRRYERAEQAGGQAGTPLGMVADEDENDLFKIDRGYYEPRAEEYRIASEGMAKVDKPVSDPVECYLYDPELLAELNRIWPDPEAANEQGPSSVCDSK